MDQRSVPDRHIWIDHAKIPARRIRPTQPGRLPNLRLPQRDKDNFRSLTLLLWAAPASDFLVKPSAIPPAAETKAKGFSRVWVMAALSGLGVAIGFLLLVFNRREESKRLSEELLEQTRREETPKRKTFEEEIADQLRTTNERPQPQARLVPQGLPVTC